MPLNHYHLILFVNIVGCSKLDDTVSVFDINHSTFSQAPGTEVLLSCNLNNGDEIIRTTCQDDGRWEPDVSSMLCRLDGKSFMRCDISQACM